MSNERRNAHRFRHRTALHLGGTAAAAAALAARADCAHPILAQQASPPVATPTGAGGNFAGLVNIGGGRRLWLECRGSGSPTVILESGYDNDADIWDTIALPPNLGKTAVLPGVATFTRVRAYDRPGTILDPADPAHRGRSTPIPMPRTARDIVADLHTLLHAADVPGPYVLVGHSIGGIFVRLYASPYPDEVAGMVLVDASHEDQNARLQAVLTPKQLADFERLEFELPPGLAGYPIEKLDLDASFAQQRTAERAHPLPPMPLVVLSHGIPYSAVVPPDAIPGFPWDKVEQVWQELQDELAALVANARHIIAEQSGHYIQLQQPELVINAVHKVEAVRGPTSWVTPGP